MGLGMCIGAGQCSGLGGCICAGIGHRHRRGASNHGIKDVIDRRIDGNPWQCQRIGGTSIIDWNTIGGQ